MQFLVISTLFLITGFSALVYQALWFRQLGLIFGNTVAAATATISAFMFGMAVGSLLFGRLARRRMHPLVWFSLISCFIGVSALLVPSLFHGLTWIFVAFARNVSDQPAMLTFIRFVGAFIVLLIPSMLMGGSLPVLAKGILHTDSKFGGKLGWLYGINTLGAALGVLVAGFYLIETFGLFRTNLIAVACNFLVAITGLLLARRFPAQNDACVSIKQQFSWRMPWRAWLILVIIFMSGFLALAFEIIWFRALILVFGSTTYSFSAMLCIFLLGLGLGSMIISQLNIRYKNALFIFGVTELVLAVFTIWSLHQFDLMPEFLLERLVNHGLTWHTLVISQFMIAFFFLFIPTLCFGVDIPLTTAALVRYLPDTPTATGRIYAFNTAGSVLGTVVAGFILLPQLGMLNSLILLAVLTAGLGVLVLMLSQAPRFDRLVVGGLAGAFLLFNLIPRPVWEEDVMAAGPYFNPSIYIQDGEIVFRAFLDESRLLYFEEGIAATVAVRESDDHQLKYISDGKVEADTSMRSMTLQRMQGHLPMLFHPSPKRVLNIGLGAGVTFGALSCYPTDLLQVVEIEPASIEVARVFSKHNHDIINNPLAQFIINDGRNHLLYTTNIYDVITSDPFEPVHSGAGHLYTVDHFRKSRARLAEDGIMCQYLPLYEMSEVDYLTILYSFLHVFPNTAVFYTGDDTVLLGFNGKIHFHPKTLETKLRIPAVAESLAELGFQRPDQLLSMYVATFREGDGHVPLITRLNTDNDPVIEFSAPRSALHVTTDANQAALLTISSGLPPEFLSLPKERLENLQRQQEALRMAMRANVLRADGEVLRSIDMLQEAYDLSDENPVIKHRLADVLVRYAQLLQRRNRFAEAAQIHRRILDLRTDEFWSLFQLTRFYINTGHHELAAFHLQTLEMHYPESAVADALHAYFSLITGDHDEAERLMRQAVERRPDKAALWLSYSRLFNQMNRPEEARRGQVLYEQLRR